MVHLLEEGGDVDGLCWGQSCMRGGVHAVTPRAMSIAAMRVLLAATVDAAMRARAVWRRLARISVKGEVVRVA
jgi:hypothetical protein